MHFNRREFLRKSICAALGGASIYSVLGNLRLVQAAARQSAYAFNDYRALVCVYLGGGNDLFYHGAPGTIVYTGPGHDEVHVSPGVDFPDLDRDDRVAVGTLDLFGGLRNVASASVWAQSLGGMFQYGKDSAGELVVLPLSLFRLQPQLSLPPTC